MAKIEPIVGRYVYVTVDGVEYRTYYEESGKGIPLVCGHTAGSDSRQFRHVLNDPEATKDFRIIAFDLPRHGKSLPPDNWWTEEYILKEKWYCNFIVAFCKALELKKPVFMGCSMGGNICPHLALRYPAEFGALIALEASDWSGLQQATGEAMKTQWGFDWFWHPEVNGGEACGTSIYSLMAPTSPEQYRREVFWCYSQGAPGVFRGDLLFWGLEHDVRETAKNIDTSKTPMYIVAGEYDWSTPPEQGKRLADKIKGSKLITMKGLGHFPPCENPEAFMKYLRDMLRDIKTNRKD